MGTPSHLTAVVQGALASVGLATVAACWNGAAQAQDRSISTLRSEEAMRFSKENFHLATDSFGIHPRVVFLAPTEGDFLSGEVAGSGSGADFTMIVLLRWLPQRPGSTRIEFSQLRKDGGLAQMGYWVVARDPDGGIVFDDLDSPSLHTMCTFGP